MNKLRVAVLGVGKIGEFHAREFHNMGCEVVAILTSSEKSSKEKVEKLKKFYGIDAKPYFNLEDLLKNENLDIISICTPPKFHAEQIRKCLEYGLNILCEKPLVYDSIDNNYKISKELLKIAKSKRRVLSVNTQWISLLGYIPAKKFQNIKSFSIYMESSKADHVDMIMDIIPHMNSFIIELFGKKKIKNLQFLSTKEKEIDIFFDYGDCEVKYILKSKEERPRKIEFSIDNLKFERKILEGYKLELVYNGGSVKIEDPLKISIKKFVTSIEKGEKPLIGPEKILQNIKLQDFIAKAYLSTL